MGALVLAALAVGVVGGGTAAAVRRAGEPRAAAVRLGVIAAIATAGVGVVGFFVTFGECLAENNPRPLSYPWSPRRQYCQAGSAESNGGLALLLLPAAGIIFGTILKRRERVALSLLAYGLVPFALVAPMLYVSALPYYLLADTKVFHDPVLRPADGELAPRVCMLYSVRYSPAGETVIEDDPDEPRTCVDLEPTLEATQLTQDSYQLEELTRHLSEDGEDVDEGDTGISGIVITDVRRATLEEADVRGLDANGQPLPSAEETADVRWRTLRLAREMSAMLESCYRLRRSYARCDEPAQRRFVRPMGELDAGIVASPETPRQYKVTVQGPGGLVEVARWRDTPRDSPPLVTCFDQFPCPIGG